MQEQELEAERHECEALCDKVNLEWYSSWLGRNRQKSWLDCKTVWQATRRIANAPGSINFIASLDRCKGSCLKKGWALHFYHHRGRKYMSGAWQKFRSGIAQTLEGRDKSSPLGS